MSAGATLSESSSRFSLLRKLKQKLDKRREEKGRNALRKIKERDAKLLQKVTDDATVDTNVSIPRTLREALPDDLEKRANDPRAIVVTECTGKFNMIGCNKAWENLCGYAECEITDKNSEILQGPDSNYEGLHDAVTRLFEGEKKVRCVTTNYRKDGSKFKNLLTLGPLHDEKTGELTHFVAILKNIGKA